MSAYAVVLMHPGKKQSMLTGMRLSPIYLYEVLLYSMLSSIVDLRPSGTLCLCEMPIAAF